MFYNSDSLPSLRWYIPIDPCPGYFSSDFRNVVARYFNDKGYVSRPEYIVFTKIGVQMI